MSENTNIILAAVNATAPRSELGNRWESEVRRTAEDIILMTNPEGRFAKGLEDFKTMKPFVAVVSEVGREERSKRGFIGLASENDSGRNKGVDTIRTDRYDSSPDAAVMIRELANLRGHRVLIWKRMEATKDDQKVRILHRYQDLGKAKDELIETLRPKLREASELVLEKAVQVPAGS